MPVITPHVPDGLIDLMKALTKSVLKEKPENIYEFAVQHFEKLIIERDGSLDKGYEIFRSEEIYFKTISKYEKMRSKLVRNTNLINNFEAEQIDTKDEEEENDTQTSQSATVQRKFKIRKLSSRKPSENLISIKEEEDEEAAKAEIESEMRRREWAAFQIQRAFRIFQRKLKKKSEAPGKRMTEEVAALIIQRSLKAMFTNRLKDSKLGSPSSGGIICAEKEFPEVDTENELETDIPLSEVDIVKFKSSEPLRQNSDDQHPSIAFGERCTENEAQLELSETHLDELSTHSGNEDGGTQKGNETFTNEPSTAVMSSVSITSKDQVTNKSELTEKPQPQIEKHSSIQNHNEEQESETLKPSSELDIVKEFRDDAVPSGKSLDINTKNAQCLLLGEQTVPEKDDPTYLRDHEISGSKLIPEKPIAVSPFVTDEASPKATAVEKHADISTEKESLAIIIKDEKDGKLKVSSEIVSPSSTEEPIIDVVSYKTEEIVTSVALNPNETHQERNSPEKSDDLKINSTENHTDMTKDNLSAHEPSRSPSNEVLKKEPQTSEIDTPDEKEIISQSPLLALPANQTAVDLEDSETVEKESLMELLHNQKLFIDKERKNALSSDSPGVFGTEDIKTLSKVTQLSKEVASDDQHNLLKQGNNTVQVETTEEQKLRPQTSQQELSENKSIVSERETPVQMAAKDQHEFPMQESKTEKQKLSQSESKEGDQTSELPEEKPIVSDTSLSTKMIAPSQTARGTDDPTVSEKESLMQLLHNQKLFIEEERKNALFSESMKFRVSTTESGNAASIDSQVSKNFSEVIDQEYQGSKEDMDAEKVCFEDTKLQLSEEMLSVQHSNGETVSQTEAVENDKQNNIVKNEKSNDCRTLRESLTKAATGLLVAAVPTASALLVSEKSKDNTEETESSLLLVASTTEEKFQENADEFEKENVEVLKSAALSLTNDNTKASNSIITSAQDKNLDLPQQISTDEDKLADVTDNLDEESQPSLPSSKASFHEDDVAEALESHICGSEEFKTLPTHSDHMSNNNESLAAVVENDEACITVDISPKVKTEQVALKTVLEKPDDQNLKENFTDDEKLKDICDDQAAAKKEPKLVTAENTDILQNTTGMNVQDMRASSTESTPQKPNVDGQSLDDGSNDVSHEEKINLEASVVLCHPIEALSLKACETTDEVNMKIESTEEQNMGRNKLEAKNTHSDIRNENLVNTLIDEVDPLNHGFDVEKAVTDNKNSRENEKASPNDQVATFEDSLPTNQIATSFPVIEDTTDESTSPDDLNNKNKTLNIDLIKPETDKPDSNIDQIQNYETKNQDKPSSTQTDTSQSVSYDSHNATLEADHESLAEASHEFQNSIKDEKAEISSFPSQAVERSNLELLNEIEESKVVEAGKPSSDVKAQDDARNLSPPTEDNFKPPEDDNKLPVDHSAEVPEVKNYHESAKSQTAVLEPKSPMTESLERQETRPVVTENNENLDRKNSTSSDEIKHLRPASSVKGSSEYQKHSTEDFETLEKIKDSSLDTVNQKQEGESCTDPNKIDLYFTTDKTKDAKPERVVKESFENTDDLLKNSKSPEKASESVLDSEGQTNELKSLQNKGIEQTDETTAQKINSKTQDNDLAELSLLVFEEGETKENDAGNPESINISTETGKHKATKTDQQGKDIDFNYDTYDTVELKAIESKNYTIGELSVDARNDVENMHEMQRFTDNVPDMTICDNKIYDKASEDNMSKNKIRSEDNNVRGDENAMKLEYKEIISEAIKSQSNADLYSNSEGLKNIFDGSFTDNETSQADVVEITSEQSSILPVEPGHSGDGKPKSTDQNIYEVQEPVISPRAKEQSLESSSITDKAKNDFRKLPKNLSSVDPIQNSTTYGEETLENRPSTKRKLDGPNDTDLISHEIQAEENKASQNVKGILENAFPGKNSCTQKINESTECSQPVEVKAVARNVGSAKSSELDELSQKLENKDSDELIMFSDDRESEKSGSIKVSKEFIAYGSSFENPESGSDPRHARSLLAAHDDISGNRELEISSEVPEFSKICESPESRAVPESFENVNVKQQSGSMDTSGFEDGKASVTAEAAVENEDFDMKSQSTNTAKSLSKDNSSLGSLLSREPTETTLLDEAAEFKEPRKLSSTDETKFREPIEQTEAIPDSDSAESHDLLKQVENKEFNQRQKLDSNYELDGTNEFNKNFDQINKKLSELPTVSTFEEIHPKLFEAGHLEQISDNVETTKLPQNSELDISGIQIENIETSESTGLDDSLKNGESTEQNTEPNSKFKSQPQPTDILKFGEATKFDEKDDAANIATSAESTATKKNSLGTGELVGSHKFISNYKSNESDEMFEECNLNKADELDDEAGSCEERNEVMKKESQTSEIDTPDEKEIISLSTLPALPVASNQTAADIEGLETVEKESLMQLLHNQKLFIDEERKNALSSDSLGVFGTEDIQALSNVTQLSKEVSSNDQHNSVMQGNKTEQVDTAEEQKLKPQTSQKELPENKPIAKERVTSVQMTAKDQHELPMQEDKIKKQKLSKSESTKRDQTSELPEEKPIVSDTSLSTKMTAPNQTALDTEKESLMQLLHNQKQFIEEERKNALFSESMKLRDPATESGNAASIDSQVSENVREAIDHEYHGSKEDMDAEKVCFEKTKLQPSEEKLSVQHSNGKTVNQTEEVENDKQNDIVKNEKSNDCRSLGESLKKAATGLLVAAVPATASALLVSEKSKDKTDDTDTGIPKFRESTKFDEKHDAANITTSVESTSAKNNSLGTKELVESHKFTSNDKSNESDKTFEERYLNKANEIDDEAGSFTKNGLSGISGERFDSHSLTVESKAELSSRNDLMNVTQNGNTSAVSDEATVKAIIELKDQDVSSTNGIPVKPIEENNKDLIDDNERIDASKLTTIAKPVENSEKTVEPLEQTEGIGDLEFRSSNQIDEAFGKDDMVKNNHSCEANISIDKFVNIDMSTENDELLEFTEPVGIHNNLLSTDETIISVKNVEKIESESSPTHESKPPVDTIENLKPFVSHKSNETSKSVQIEELAENTTPEEICQDKHNGNLISAGKTVETDEPCEKPRLANGEKTTFANHINSVVEVIHHMVDVNESVQKHESNKAQNVHDTDDFKLSTEEDFNPKMDDKTGSDPLIGQIKSTDSEISSLVNTKNYVDTSAKNSKPDQMSPPFQNVLPSTHTVIHSGIKLKDQSRKEAGVHEKNEDDADKEQVSVENRYDTYEEQIKNCKEISTDRIEDEHISKTESCTGVSDGNYVKIADNTSKVQTELNSIQNFIGQNQSKIENSAIKDPFNSDKMESVPSSMSNLFEQMSSDLDILPAAKPIDENHEKEVLRKSAGKSGKTTESQESIGNSDQHSSETALEKLTNLAEQEASNVKPLVPSVTRPIKAGKPKSKTNEKLVNTTPEKPENVQSNNKKEEFGNKQELLKVQEHQNLDQSKLLSGDLNDEIPRNIFDEPGHGSNNLESTSKTKKYNEPAITHSETEKLEIDPHILSEPAQENAIKSIESEESAQNLPKNNTCYTPISEKELSAQELLQTSDQITIISTNDSPLNNKETFQQIGEDSIMSNSPANTEKEITPTENIVYEESTSIILPKYDISEKFIDVSQESPNRGRHQLQEKEQVAQSNSQEKKDDDKPMGLNKQECTSQISCSEEKFDQPSADIRSQVESQINDTRKDAHPLNPNAAGPAMEHSFEETSGFTDSTVVDFDKKPVGLRQTLPNVSQLASPQNDLNPEKSSEDLYLLSQNNYDQKITFSDSNENCNMDAEKSKAKREAVNSQRNNDDEDIRDVKNAENEINFGSTKAENDEHLPLDDKLDLKEKVPVNKEEWNTEKQLLDVEAVGSQKDEPENVEPNSTTSNQSPEKRTDSSIKDKPETMQNLHGGVKKESEQSNINAIGANSRNHFESNIFEQKNVLPNSSENLERFELKPQSNQIGVISADGLADEKDLENLRGTNSEVRFTPNSETEFAFTEVFTENTLVQKPIIMESTSEYFKEHGEQSNNFKDEETISDEGHAVAIRLTDSHVEELFDREVSSTLDKINENGRDSLTETNIDNLDINGTEMPETEKTPLSSNDLLQLPDSHKLIDELNRLESSDELLQKGATTIPLGSSVESTTPKPKLKIESGAMAQSEVSTSPGAASPIEVVEKLQKDIVTLENCPTKTVLEENKNQKSDTEENLQDSSPALKHSSKKTNPSAESELSEKSHSDSKLVLKKPNSENEIVVESGKETFVNEEANLGEPKAYSVSTNHVMQENVKMAQNENLNSANCSRMPDVITAHISMDESPNETIETQLTSDIIPKSFGEAKNTKDDDLKTSIDSSNQENPMDFCSVKSSTGTPFTHLAKNADKNNVLRVGEEQIVSSDIKSGIILEESLGNLHNDISAETIHLTPVGSFTLQGQIADKTDDQTLAAHQNIAEHQTIDIDESNTAVLDNSISDISPTVENIGKSTLNTTNQTVDEQPSSIPMQSDTDPSNKISALHQEPLENVITLGADLNQQNHERKPSELEPSAQPMKNSEHHRNEPEDPERKVHSPGHTATDLGYDPKLNSELHTKPKVTGTSAELADISKFSKELDDTFLNQQKSNEDIVLTSGVKKGSSESEEIALSQEDFKEDKTPELSANTSYNVDDDPSEDLSIHDSVKERYNKWLMLRPSKNEEHSPQQPDLADVVLKAIDHSYSEYTDDSLTFADKSMDTESHFYDSLSEQSGSVDRNAIAVSPDHASRISTAPCTDDLLSITEPLCEKETNPLKHNVVSEPLLSTEDYPDSLEISQNLTLDLPLKASKASEKEFGHIKSPIAKKLSDKGLTQIESYPSKNDKTIFSELKDVETGEPIFDYTTKSDIRPSKQEENWTFYNELHSDEKANELEHRKSSKDGSQKNDNTGQPELQEKPNSSNDNYMMTLRNNQAEPIVNKLKSPTQSSNHVEKIDKEDVNHLPSEQNTIQITASHLKAKSLDLETEQNLPQPPVTQHKICEQPQAQLSEKNVTLTGIVAQEKDPTIMEDPKTPEISEHTISKQFSENNLPTMLIKAAETIQNALRSYTNPKIDETEESKNLEDVKSELKATIPIVETNNKLTKSPDSKGVWYVGDDPIIPTLTKETDKKFENDTEDVPGESSIAKEHDNQDLVTVKSEIPNKSVAGQLENSPTKSTVSEPFFNEPDVGEHQQVLKVENYTSEEPMDPDIQSVDEFKTLSTSKSTEDSLSAMHSELNSKSASKIEIESSCDKASEKQQNLTESHSTPCVYSNKQVPNNEALQPKLDEHINSKIPSPENAKRQEFSLENVDKAQAAQDKTETLLNSEEEIFPATFKGAEEGEIIDSEITGLMQKLDTPIEVTNETHCEHSNNEDVTLIITDGELLAVEQFDSSLSEKPVSQEMSGQENELSNINIQKDPEVMSLSNEFRKSDEINDDVLVEESLLATGAADGIDAKTTEASTAISEINDEKFLQTSENNKSQAGSHLSSAKSLGKSQEESPRTDVENIDISVYGEDSLEAMYYSLKRHELLLDKMHKKASVCKSASSEKGTPERVEEKSLKDKVQNDFLLDAKDDKSENTDSKAHSPHLEESNVKSLRAETIETSTELNDDLSQEATDYDLSLEPLPPPQERKLSRNDSYYTACLSRPITSATISPRSRSAHDAENPIQLSKQRTEEFMQQLHDDHSLDDTTKDEIRRNMLAYSVSEADSDYCEPGKRTNAILNDFNISTAFENTPSTDTDSTIVSAVTKIQAGARGFLTRRRLRRASVATTSFSDRRPSFGNDAIGESLEDLIDEEDAAKRIQKSFRRYRNRKTRQSAPTLRNNIEESNSSKSSNGSSEEGIVKIIEVKVEQKPLTPSDKEAESFREHDLCKQTDSKENKINSNELNLSTTDGHNDESEVSFDEINLAARRMTLQRGDAVQRNSTAESENSSMSGGNNNKSNDGQTAKNQLLPRAKSSGSERRRKNTERNNERAKRFTTRQRSMPVQIDFEILRVLPRHLRKRIRSAEEQNKP